MLRWVSEGGVLSGAMLEDPRDRGGGGEELLSCSGAFLAIGHKPMTGFLASESSSSSEQGQQSGVELDDDGYIVHKEVT